MIFLKNVNMLMLSSSISRNIYYLLMQITITLGTYPQAPQAVLVLKELEIEDN